MNYLDARYELDKELFPNRVIVGTETFPTRIDHNWALVTGNAHVIGDFTWTGFDYLGEVGIGRALYLDEGEAPSLTAPYPWIAAWCGDLDLIGGRRPASFYREIVFGLRKAPYIAVCRPETVGKHFYAWPWSWSDSIGSWTWTGHGGLLTVEVYSDAEEVELALNGHVIGTGPAGRANRYKAEFAVTYQPGELTATAIRNGQHAESFTLTSASKAHHLALTAESGDLGQLVFVEVAVVDQDGRRTSSEDQVIGVQVQGDGELAAVGSGDPAPGYSYDGASGRTFDGVALVIVHRTGPGPIEVRVSASESVSGAALTDPFINCRFEES
jgi:hypothetical protein